MARLFSAVSQYRHANANKRSQFQIYLARSFFFSFVRLYVRYCCCYCCCESATNQKFWVIKKSKHSTTKKPIHKYTKLIQCYNICSSMGLSFSFGTQWNGICWGNEKPEAVQKDEKKRLEEILAFWEKCYKIIPTYDNSISSNALCLLACVYFRTSLH